MSISLKGKKVLVTGADGFIGSHLTQMLVEKGCAVRALSNYNSFNYWGHLEELSCLEEVEVIPGDIRDYGVCEKITKGVDIVFNLAALIAIPYSYLAPASYIDTNINGALNICQSAIANDVSLVIQTSTSEVYGTAKYVPIDENHLLSPQSPYSASKIGADAIAMSFYNSFSLPVCIARPFNTYGPRQSARAFIPTIITQLASKAETVKLGDVTPTRDLNYVLDTCNGICKIAECDEAPGQTINIGSNCEISILRVFELIKEIMGSTAELVTDESRIRPANSEVFRLWCDNSKIMKLTGFKPEYDIRRGLEETVKWMTIPENLAKYKAGLYNV